MGEAGVNQEEYSSFTWYSKDDTKVLILAFTQEETSMAQISIRRLKIALQRISQRKS